MRRIVAVPDGTFLVGGLAYRQLFRIRGRRLERIKLPGPGGNAQGIELDEKGRGWVGFDDGVCRVEGNDCVPEILPEDGLQNATVRSLGLGASGVVWVAYRNGIGFSQFRRVKDRWVARHFTAAGGYDYPDTQFLQTDRRGWIWRGTDDGLFVSDGVHLDPGDWMRITETEGLPSSRINRFGFLEDKDGTIWIGTERGIARIRPDSSWFSAAEPARITSAEQRSHIVFSNESLSLPVGGVSLFPIRYRLNPRDKEWQVGRSGKLSLTNLRAGRYELETAKGPAGEVSRYSFEVRTSATARLLSVSAVGVPLVGATGIAWMFLLRKRRATSLQPLPDLTAARLEVLLPETQRLTGSLLDDRFVLGRIVARGGFGTVFQANDLREDRSCAIKVFREEFGDAGFARRFEQEVTALEAVSHPNIVKTLGHGMTPGGSPYLAMEFIDGHTLRDVLPSDGLPPATCGTLLRQIGGALHEIHSQSIFHRDIKPENLMIRTSGPSSESLVLIDFSMAIVKDPDKSFHGLSRAGGTFHYMAPEQALGHAGAEADIYSLAKVLMEMLTGQRLSLLLPDATLDLAERVAELLRQRGFGLSRPSMELLASAVEFDPGRRPKSVLTFAQRIASDLDGAVSPTVLPVANVSPCSSDGAPDEASASSPGPIPPE